MEQPETVNLNLPSALESFCFEQPLYSPVRVTDWRHLSALLKPTTASITGHCTGCKALSIFHVVSPETQLDHNAVARKEVVFQCARTYAHQVTVFVQIQPDAKSNGVAISSPAPGYTVEKVGQMPSHADIASGQLKHLGKIEPTNRAELMRSMGLAAHGVNIGAFVYLRRVLERLVNSHWAESIGVPKDEFKGLTVPERIAHVKESLPPFLVEHRAIYGVLSKGIHELSEVECGKYVHVMWNAILSILEQDLEAAKRKRREEELAASIRSIVQTQNSEPV